MPLICLPALALDGPRTPEEAIASFQLEPGLKIELVAAEPLVVDPVAIAFDEQGRMFVVENRGYPIGPAKGNPPAGQVALLEDSDGDGKYDKRTTFADGLTFPNGVMPWKGGVYVTCAPDVFYFKDTDGDGVADIKQIVFTGFQDSSTTQLRVSHPTFSLDNWVYLTSGLTAGKITSPLYTDHPTVTANRTDFRFRPDQPIFEETAGTSQFGQTFDKFGRRFTCSNRNHIQQVMMQLKYLKRNPLLAFSEIVQDIPDHGAACKVFPISANITTAASHTGYFTSACGVTIYEGTALPEVYRGNSFTCEPAGNLIHRDVLSPSNATFVAKRAYETQEFLASPDNWFRPVNLEVGPDGALYVCDMYRKTIEHPEYLPEATRKITDFQSGKDKGRIYRISAVGVPPSGGTPTNFAKANVKELCAELNNPNRWWRMTAHRLLIERQDKSAVSILKSLVKKGKTPEARVHALRILGGLGALEEKQIRTALSDKDPNVREHGIQLAEAFMFGVPPSVAPGAEPPEGGTPNGTRSNLDARILNLADDPNARVRFQCALTLGELQNPKVIPALAKIAERDMKDRWTRAAVLSSINGRALELLTELLPVAKRISQRAERTNEIVLLLPLLSDLGRILGADRTNANVSTLLLIISSTNWNDFDWQLALLSGFADGLRSSKGNIGKDSPLKSVLDSISTDMWDRRINEIMKRAVTIATDASQALSRRLIAIGLLSHADFSNVGSALETSLNPSQPSEIQIAAVRALTQIPGTNGGVALVKKEHWNGYTPAVREAVLAAMTAQTNLLQALLAGIENSNVPPWTINPERRNNLIKHKDELIRNRAIALFKDLQSVDRMKVYEEYKSVLALTPNATNGHAVFTRTCASCHVFENEGKSVGPDLTGIRNQPADVLLLHILVPEFEMMPIYTTYNIETKDGQSLSGILAGETAAQITLRQALGIESLIQRSNIESMKTSRLSLMPQELEKTMSKQDLADLIGFLKTGNAR